MTSPNPVVATPGLSDEHGRDYHRSRTIIVASFELIDAFIVPEGVLTFNQDRDGAGEITVAYPHSLAGWV